MNKWNKNEFWESGGHRGERTRVVVRSWWGTARSGATIANTPQMTAQVPAPRLKRAVKENGISSNLFLIVINLTFEVHDRENKNVQNQCLSQLSV